jgi:hypothetical protein
VGIAMRKITLLCSLHGGNGLCNADELLRVLRVIDPEVIFGEVPQSDRSFYHPRSLEGQAVTRFLELKPSCQTVRVDQYDMPSPAFRTITDAVFDFVEGRSQEYQQLIDQRDHATNQRGLAYLNSHVFNDLMTRMLQIEEEAVKASGNQDLIQGLTQWRRVNQERENAMLENIGRYCRENVFEKGVFLVGAAHQVGILKAIKENAVTDSRPLAWTFEC